MFKEFKEIITYDNINKKMSNSTVSNNDVVTQNVSDNSRVTGCVKWFNNKAGYGFITVSNGPHAGDVFVHHSAINVGDEQYRFLVQGEYVEFECLRVEEGPHQWQASNVTGPNSGRLMCETRHAVRHTRSTRVHNDQTPEHTKPRLYREQTQYVPTQHQRPHRSMLARGTRVASYAENDGYEWQLVRKHPSNKQDYQGVRPQYVERSDRPNYPRRVRSVVNAASQ